MNIAGNKLLVLFQNGSALQSSVQEVHLSNLSYNKIYFPEIKCKIFT